MDIYAVIIAIAAISFVASLLLPILKLSKLSMENVSAFLEIKKRLVEMKAQAATVRTTHSDTPTQKSRFSVSIPDMLSYVSLISASYILVTEYISNAPIDRQAVLSIASMFSLIVFNLAVLRFRKLQRTADEDAMETIKMIGGVYDVLDVQQTQLDMIFKRLPKE